MRLLPAVFVVLASISAASAQENPAVQAGAPTAASEAPPPVKQPRLTWEQRFAQANVTHDGHLTLEQAKAGFPTIGRHFADIDQDNKGYVTEDDVRTWRKARASHHAAQSSETGRLQPRQALHRLFPSTRPINTAAGRTVPNSERTPDVGDELPEHGE